MRILSVLLGLLGSAVALWTGCGPEPGLDEPSPPDLMAMDLAPVDRGFVLDLVSPTVGPSSGGISLTLTGAHFVPGMSVTIGGLPATETQLLSPQQLLVVLPPHPGVAGPVPVTLRKPDGDTVTRSDLYSYFSVEMAFRQYYASVGARPVAVTTADLNGDGLQDIVTANNSAGSVSVLLTTKTESFSGPFDYPAAVSPTAITTGDVNNDGKSDIVTGNGQKINILIGNGLGKLNAPMAFLTPLPSNDTIMSIKAVDVNKDNNIDIILTSTGSLCVLLGNGTGNFVFKPPLLATGFGYSLDVGDLNNDGRLDIVTGNASVDSVKSFLGNGDGSFFLSSKVGNFVATSVALADLNEDGKLDVVAPTGSIDGQNLAILLGKGDGSFQTPALFASALWPAKLVASDLNRDGHIDIAALDSLDESIYYFYGNGDGRLGPSNRVQTLLGSGVNQSFTAADLNRDGRAELIRVGDQVNALMVAWGRANQLFDTSIQRLPSLGLDIGDLNRDGHPDLVSSGFTEISVSLGAGDGLLKSPVLFSTGPYKSLNQSAAVGICNLNGDDKPDIVAVNPDFVMHTFLGDGAGGFTLGKSYETFFDDFRIADLNGDGLEDVVGFFRNSQNGQAFLSNGDGSLTPRPKFILGSLVGQIALSDIDSDGRIDVLATNAGIYALLGSGDGTFLKKVPIDSYRGASSVLSVDLNKDGVVDLVAGTRVMHGNGDGSFRLVQQLDAFGTALRGLDLADIDGDGQLDLINPDPQYTGLLVLRGTVAGTFGSPLFVQMPGGVSDALVSDV